MTAHASFRIVGSVDGMETFGFDIIRYLGIYSVALRGYKLEPIANDGTIACVLTVSFQLKGPDIFSQREHFRRVLSMRPDINSVTIVPTEH